MLKPYGSQVSVTAGFYSGQTGTIIQHSSVFEGETEVNVYNIRLDVSPADVTGLVREDELEDL